jgi:hypothetical protein
MISRRGFVILLAGLLGLIQFSYAQEDDLRDYAISEVRQQILENENETLLQIAVEVMNNGTEAQGVTEVIFTLLAEPNQELARIELQPLKADASVTVIGEFPIIGFPAGTEQTIQVSVGIDEVERADTPIADDNLETLVVSIPERAIVSAPTLFAFEGENFIILGESYDRIQVVLALAASVGIVILVWIVTVILRLVFRRPPRFAPWQPPYGLMSMYDQNTTEGRRWAWQQHAQNSLLLAPPHEGNIHAIKLLMGADGSSLTNWKITAMRLSQYDTYGRIARTQMIADKKWIRSLNGVLKNRNKMNEAKLQKALRPIADGLATAFCKNLSNKNAFLPVSFDIRWEGKHGEVRIFFELYQCVQNAWYRMDQWEPMMQVLAQKMQENFTFTIHGKTTPEKIKDFRERLRDDLIWLLMESVKVEQAPVYNPQQTPAPRQQFEIPDTLSGMSPMPSENPIPASSV